MVALKTLLFTILVPGTVTVLIPGWLVGWDSMALAERIGALRWIGLVLLLVGAWFYLRCAWDFVVAGQGTPAPIDAPKHLVVRGLYRQVRNPMYVSVLLCIGGEGLLFASARLLAYMALLLVCFHTFVVTYEEPTLRRVFGLPYEQYCAAVPRWIPRVGRGTAT
jgi:protein-S-isoprenylcysteine O-methyltransferase Ste14